MPHSFSFLFLNFRASSGNTSLQRPIMKVENMLFNAYSQHIPLLSPNHTHREALTIGTDSPLWPLSQEGLRTVNSSTETNMGLSHTFPQITLPSW